MTGREHLPNRRACATQDFVHNGQRYSMAAGYFPGTRAEIFLSSSKPGSETESIARDSAILVSLCLQHGVDLAMLRHAVTRSADGSAATAIGAALDLLAIVDLESA